MSDPKEIVERVRGAHAQAVETWSVGRGVFATETDPSFIEQLLADVPVLLERVERGQQREAEIHAAALRAAADEAEAIMIDADVAAAAAAVPGEHGRQAAADRWTALCEEPHEWLRARAAEIISDVVDEGCGQDGCTTCHGSGDNR